MNFWYAEVLDLGRRFFGLEPSESLKLVVADGIKFLAASLSAAFDVIILDVATACPAVCSHFCCMQVHATVLLTIPM
jgi:spermidine synthase